MQGRGVSHAVSKFRTAVVMKVTLKDIKRSYAVVDGGIEKSH